MGQQFFLVIHIILALAIIGLVLLQHGKGAEVGASFGSGASQTLFGSRGAATFLTKLTALLAICFAITSLSMSYLASKSATSKKSIVDTIKEVQQAEEIPSIAEETPVQPLPKSKHKKPRTGKQVQHSNAKPVNDIAEPSNLEQQELTEASQALHNEAANVNAAEQQQSAKQEHAAKENQLEKSQEVTGKEK